MRQEAGPEVGFLHVPSVIGGIPESFRGASDWSDDHDWGVWEDDSSVPHYRHEVTVA
ncbi:MAG: hypothetical protein R6U88_00445 [Candidatus Bipolaricaulota bacterium]